MKITIKKYSLFVFCLFVLAACGNRRYMLIGIEKTEELKLANTRGPQSNVVNKDSLTLNLKENQKVIYYDNTADYAAKNLDSLNTKRNSTQKKLPAKKVVKSKKLNQTKTSADKLNDAIKIKN